MYQAWQHPLFPSSIEPAHQNSETTALNLITFHIARASVWTLFWNHVVPYNDLTLCDFIHCLGLEEVMS